jgi:hypothetical protein
MDPATREAPVLAWVRGNPSHYEDQADRKGRWSMALVTVALIVLGILAAIARATGLLD